MKMKENVNTRSHIRIEEITQSGRSTKRTPTFSANLKSLTLGSMTAKNLRSLQMYEDAFKKEDKIKNLEKKLKQETGLTFKPKIKKNYRTPTHVKVMKNEADGGGMA